MIRIQKFVIGFLRYLLVPGSILLLLFFLLPAPTQFSWRWFGFFILLIIFVELALWLQVRYIVAPSWHGCSSPKMLGWALVTSLFSLVLFACAAPDMTRIMEKLPFLAPEETIELVPILNTPGSTLEIWKVKIGDDRVPTSDFLLRGTWKEEDNRLWTKDPEARLVLKGKVPSYISISFWRSPSAGQVLVRWDGKSKILDLRGEHKEEALFRFVFNPSSRKEPDLSRWIRFLTLPGFACLAFLATGVFYFND